MREEVPAMTAIAIPDPLPPAITLPREVLEFAITEHLKQFGESGPVARTWRWILYGHGLGPISHMNWAEFDGDGPPSTATLAAESTADPSPLCRAPWAELNKARFICWWSTSGPEDEVPLRFRPWTTGNYPTITEHGSVTITTYEQRGG
jgi:hypothetical protein